MSDGVVVVSCYSVGEWPNQIPLTKVHSIKVTVTVLAHKPNNSRVYSII